MVDGRLLGGRDMALQPHEGAVLGQPAPEFAGIEFRHGGGEKLDGLVDIDDLARIGEERGQRMSEASSTPLRSTMSGRGIW
jgi:hypothetical protein